MPGIWIANHLELYSGTVTIDIYGARKSILRAAPRSALPIGSRAPSSDRASISRRRRRATSRAGSPARDQLSATQGLRSTPTLSMSTSQTSPSRSQRFGSRPMPTPLGVPVTITSPGSSVIAAEM